MKEIRTGDKIYEATLLTPVKNDIPVCNDSFLLAPTDDTPKSVSDASREGCSADYRKPEVRDG